jgi:hypothetical protein
MEDYKYVTKYITTAIDTFKGNLFNANISCKMAIGDRLSSKEITVDTSFWRSYKLLPLSNCKEIFIDTVLNPLEKDITNIKSLKENLNKRLVTP